MSNRRKLPSVLAGLAFVVCCTTVPHQAEAATAPRTYLDGREITFDVDPYIVRGTTLVPVRGLMTPFGATFEWNPSTQTAVVHRGDTNMELTVGSPTAKVNGQVKALPVVVTNTSGRLMLPIRFVAESFGLSVNWNSSAYAVEITDPSRGAIATSDRGTVERSQARRAVETARLLVGKPYAWGGTGPNAFDCSGFIQYVAKQVGVWLPRTSYEQYGAGKAVAKSVLQPGDLVFFNADGSGASHVGIYIGNDSFVHAENETVGVVITSLSKPWWATRYMGARHVFN